MPNQLRTYKASIFQALSHPTRIAVLEALRNGESAVQQMRAEYDRRRRLGDGHGGHAAPFPKQYARNCPRAQVRNMGRGSAGEGRRNYAVAAWSARIVRSRRSSGPNPSRPSLDRVMTPIVTASYRDSFLREAGIRLHYHNHDFEFLVQFGGKRIIDIMLEELDPAACDLCVDVAWVHRGGDDPALERSARRYLDLLKGALLHEHFAGFDREAEILHCGEVAVELGETLDLDHPPPSRDALPRCEELATL